MESTTGLVHQISSTPFGQEPAQMCVIIGPTWQGAGLFTIPKRTSDPVYVAAYKTAMVDALTVAMITGHIVSVGYEESDAAITSVNVR